MTPPAIARYLTEIESIVQRGNATEHSYRPALKALFEGIREGVVATNEPKRIACGAPDLIVERMALPLGYVEAKDVGADLDAAAETPQLRRYLRGLPNLVLTNHLEFWWFVDGKVCLKAHVGHLSTKNKLESVDSGPIIALLTEFLNPRTQIINSPKELAQRMAGVAQLICSTIEEALAKPQNTDPLAQQLDGFRKVLIEDLTIQQFADMYAQTLCYGLFAARCNIQGKSTSFTREHAAFDLPQTNPFLRRLFGYIAGPNLDERIAWAIDDLVALINHSDIEAILRDFGKRSRREDPVVHFYETFLSAYDSRLRALRGVYYTPEPVIQYIVRSVDHVLTTQFGLPDGLADAATFRHRTRKAAPAGARKTKRELAEERESETDIHRVLVLDPAVGTGAFLSAVVALVHERVRSAGNIGAWSDYVSRHLLPRLLGFELLMAPYAVAHMKLGLQLAETGYDFKSPERLRVFLTNTLKEPHALANLPLFTEWLADEANAAGAVKRDLPIMVILGNPPYSNFGQMNREPWILKLLEDYKKGLNERKINLDDAFIKFIRFSQWRIDRSGSGVLAFITSNTFLDGITHRRMRESLIESFSEIYILDLHGSSKKLETAPDKSRDENVFDIQQGVSIVIMIKRATTSATTARVHHAEIWGSRETKYRTLEETDISKTNWRALQPEKPLYFFVPKDMRHKEEFEAYPSLNEGVFLKKNTGIQTKRDSLVYHIERSDLEVMLKDLRTLSPAKFAKKYDLPKDGRDWTVALASDDVKSNEGLVTKVLYHPFDERWTWYSGKTKGLMAYPRAPLMLNTLRPNIILLTVRNPRRGNVDSFFAASTLVDKDAVSPFDNATFFPLYLYHDDAKSLSLGNESRTLNLAPGFTKRLATSLGLAESALLSEPEKVAHYIYAVLYSQSYRDRYAEFLKSDYPRIPATPTAALFARLSQLGKKIVEMHLMSAAIPGLSNFPQSGDCLVVAPRFDNGKVYINDKQFFDGVPEISWNFRIGGYPVLSKWLKERKGQKLAFGDIQHFNRVVAILQKTCETMAEIDSVISEHGGWPWPKG